MNSSYQSLKVADHQHNHEQHDYLYTQVDSMIDNRASTDTTNIRQCTQHTDTLMNKQYSPASTPLPYGLRPALDQNEKLASKSLSITENPVGVDGVDSVHKKCSLMSRPSHRNSTDTLQTGILSNSFKMYPHITSSSTSNNIPTNVTESSPIIQNGPKLTTEEMDNASNSKLLEEPNIHSNLLANMTTDYIKQMTAAADARNRSSDGDSDSSLSALKGRPTPSIADINGHTSFKVMNNMSHKQSTKLNSKFTNSLSNTLNHAKKNMSTKVTSEGSKNTPLVRSKSLSSGSTDPLGNKSRTKKSVARNNSSPDVSSGKDESYIGSFISR